jgi:transposase InsO family protein
MQQQEALQEVLRIRRGQRRVGARKQLVMMAAFLADHGVCMGRDTFFEVLRRGLLVRKRKRSKPQTTYSGHWLHKYDNLAAGFVPRATGQLWVSDITYLHLTDGFAYLNLITDAYNRKIVGFFLSEDLSAIVSIRALEMALAGCPLQGCLINHSDRACNTVAKGMLGC